MSSNFGLSALSRLYKQSSPEVRRRVIGIYIFLVAYNVVAWLLALLVFGADAKLLGTAFLAYTFGLRHAFDADHISAFDNVTRKLMQERQRPVGVGFFFSLGHSTVVALASAAVAGLAASLQGRFAPFKEMGGLIGTTVSALFLLLVAVANL